MVIFALVAHRSSQTFPLELWKGGRDLKLAIYTYFEYPQPSG